MQIIFAGFNSHNRVSLILINYPVLCNVVKDREKIAWIFPPSTFFGIF